MLSPRAALLRSPGRLAPPTPRRGGSRVRTYARAVLTGLLPMALGTDAGEAGAGVPPLSPGRLLTEWQWEPLPLAATLLTGGIYLYGVHRLRSRGDRWSRWRTVAFVGLGLGVVLLATVSALAAYDHSLLWVHMVQHMLLGMLAPVFLALGAPITLALRTLPLRGRQALQAVLHSRVARVLTFPVVAGVLFVVNPFALYFTGWYEATLRNEWLHALNHLHILVIGSLWFWSVLGIDPMPGRVAYPMRLIAVFVTMPFHAILGLTIMNSSTMLAGDYYRELHRGWGPSPAADQQWAGGLLWGSGDILAVIVLGVLFVQWSRASEREAIREDRRLDRLERLEGGPR